MTAFLEVLARHAEDYGVFLRTLARDLRPWRASMWLASGGVLLGTFGQLLGFGIVYKYVALLRNDTALALGGHLLGRATDLPIFLGVTLSAAAAMVGAAVLEYKGRVAAIALADDYARFGEQRVYELSTQLNARAPSLLDESMLHALLEQSRHAGNACRQLALGAAHAMALPVGFVLLFVLHSRLTLVVVGLMFASGMLLYRASLAVASVRSTELALAPAAQRERRARKRLVTAGRGGIEPGAPDESVSQLGGATNAWLDAQRRQLVLAQRIALVSHLVMALSVSSVFLVGGAQAISTGHGWGELVIFLLVLRLVGSRLMSVIRMVLGINRLYPALRRYFVIVGLLQQNRYPGPINSPEVETEDESLQPSPAREVSLLLASGDAIHLVPGEMVAIWTPPWLHRQVAGQLAEAARAQDSTTTFLPRTVRPRSVEWHRGLRLALQLSPAADAAALRERICEAGVPGLAKMIPDSLEQPINIEGLEAKARALQLLVETFQQIDSGAGALLYHEKDLQGVTHRRRNAVLGCGVAAGRLVFLQSARQRAGRHLPIQKVLVSDGRELVDVVETPDCEDSRATPSPFGARAGNAALDELLALLS